MNATEELRDMVYYKRKKFVDVTEMYDIDSKEDFMKIIYGCFPTHITTICATDQVN